jgi:hypothetical protein
VSTWSVAPAICSSMLDRLSLFLLATNCTQVALVANKLNKIVALSTNCSKIGFVVHDLHKTVFINTLRKIEPLPSVILPSDVSPGSQSGGTIAWIASRSRRA